MKARFDGKQVTLTPAYKKALIDLMKAECEMMAKNNIDGNEYFYWGRCTVKNLAVANCLSFEYGAKDDVHEDGKGRFAVLVSDQL